MAISSNRATHPTTHSPYRPTDALGPSLGPLQGAVPGMKAALYNHVVARLQRGPRPLLRATNVLHRHPSEHFTFDPRPPFFWIRTTQ